MKKLLKKIMSWSQEARVGLVIATVTLLLIGGIGVLRSWWSPTSSVNPSDSSNTTSTTQPTTNSSDNPVVLPVDETIEKPFNVNATLVRKFYDNEASLQDRMDAMVFYDGTYKCSQGLDYVYNNESFNVLASSSGTIKDIAVDSVYGLTVTVECANDVDLVYASLKSSPLQVGDEVDKGTLIGVTGESIYGSDIGCPILHFRVYKDDEVINPMEVFGLALKDIQ